LNTIYKTAIIGGGASGLMTAIELTKGDNALKPLDVIVIEKNDRLGKKISATGNGQGNLLNENFSSSFYHGDKNFINHFVFNANEIDLKAYLYDMGIPLVFDDEGRGYPMSKQASSVTDVFRFLIEKRGISVSLSTEVLDVKHNGKYFEIISEKGKILSETVVLASGGKASKQFGTDGKLYKIPVSFGHKELLTYPSLVQLKTDTKDIKGLKNLKEYVRVTAIKDGKQIKSVLGDLIFTDYGVSGLAIFKISPYVTGEKDISLKVEFLPHLSLEQTEKIIFDKQKNCPMGEEELLSGIINRKIGQAILKTANGRAYKDVAIAVKNFTLSVTGWLGFDYAQVTKGGIDTEKINPFTMESKLRRNLYLTGEILNVDGDCGGYNLTFAFVTGILSAKAIKQKFMEQIN